MCRHLAYVGPPVPLRELLTDPPWSLVRQAWEPRRQTSGVVNADGFGLGWFVPGQDVPARHRGAGPVWVDETFADLCRVVTSGGFLAAVRTGTDGMASGAAAAAPFRDEGALFSHNGALTGWPGVAARLVSGSPDGASALPPAELVGLDAPTDAALLWALVRRRLREGASPDVALGDVAVRALQAGGGTLTLLLHTGDAVAALRWGASLCWRRRGQGVVVASEPYDDGPGWRDVPEGRLVIARAGTVTVCPLLEDGRRPTGTPLVHREQAPGGTGALDRAPGGPAAGGPVPAQPAPLATRSTRRTP